MSRSLYRSAMPRRAIALVLVLIGSCSVPGEHLASLANSAGKSDVSPIRLRLTDANPSVGLRIACDQPVGCEGFVGVELGSPESCALFPDQARCGSARTEPMSRDVARVTIRS